MKIIRYKLLQGVYGREPVTIDVMLPFSEANEEIAKREAHNGEYTVEHNAEEAL